jgi:hypothetical protein
VFLGGCVVTQSCGGTCAVGVSRAGLMKVAPSCFDVVQVHSAVLVLSRLQCLPSHSSMAMRTFTETNWAQSQALGWQLENHSGPCVGRCT